MSSKLIGLLNLNISKNRSNDLKLMAMNAPGEEDLIEEIDNIEASKPKRALPPRPSVPLPPAPKMSNKVESVASEEENIETGNTTTDYLEEPPIPFPKRSSTSSKIFIKKGDLRKEVEKRIGNVEEKSSNEYEEPPPPIPKRKSSASKIVIMRGKSEKEFERKIENLTVSFECPLTLEKFEEPVILVESSQTYELKAITEWLKEHDTDPITQQKLVTKQLVPNILVKNALKDWEN